MADLLVLCQWCHKVGERYDSLTGHFILLQKDFFQLLLWLCIFIRLFVVCSRHVIQMFSIVPIHGSFFFVKDMLAPTFRKIILKIRVVSTLSYVIHLNNSLHSFTNGCKVNKQEPSVVVWVKKRVVLLVGVAFLECVWHYRRRGVTGDRLLVSRSPDQV